MPHKKLAQLFPNFFKPNKDIKESLQALRDNCDIERDSSHKIVTLHDRVWHMYSLAVEINGVKWTMLTPMDLSVCVAITDEIPANNKDILYRQYVTEAEGRDAVHTAIDRWWFICLDGFDLNVRQPNQPPSSYYAGIDKIYDLFLLHTSVDSQPKNCSQIVFSTHQPKSGSAFMGMVYKNTETSLNLKQPEAFLPVSGYIPSINLTPGYYWLSETGKPKTVVYVDTVSAKDKNLIVYYNAHIYPQMKLLSNMSIGARFQKIVA